MTGDKKVPPPARWRAVCRAADLPAAEPLAVRADGRALVLWRAADGRPAAFADRCAHMPVPLSTGRCVDGRLQCRHHGLMYEPDGRITGVYGHPIADDRRAAAFPAAERAGRIWVWLGDPNRADERRIPRILWPHTLWPRAVWPRFLRSPRRTAS